MMLWFQGSIPDAIKSAKQRSLVFVVVITGNSGKHAKTLQGASQLALEAIVAIS